MNELEILLIMSDRYVPIDEDQVDPSIRVDDGDYFMHNGLTWIYHQETQSIRLRVFNDHDGYEASFCVNNMDEQGLLQQLDSCVAAMKRNEEEMKNENKE